MDKAKKKRIKRYVTWAAMAAVVALLAVMPLLAQTEAEADGPVASVLTATVEEGSITHSLRGGGTLSADDVEDVTIPAGVKITQFLVKNGDYVTEGTPLAAVDKVSVMTTITEVRDTLEYLQEELEDAREEKISSAVKATAGGRVKKIFAEKGESVQEVMLRDGALAVLSIDGMMAVKLEKVLDISTGESVTVTINGEDVTGRVESNLDGVIVITVEDEGYAIGQNVTVRTEDDQPIGQGQLYIHNAWKATAYTGTIDTVNAKEEKTLSAGSTLFTLSDRDFEGEMQHRASQHREYEELLQELFQMYESGTLNAPCDGEVSGVDAESPYLLSAEGEWELVPLTASEEKGWTVMLLSGVGENIDVTDTLQGGGTDATPTCATSDKCKVPSNGTHNPGCIMACDRNKDCNADTHHADCIKRCTKKDGCKALNHYADCITLCAHGATVEKCAAQNHYADCIHSCKKAKTDGKCPGTKHHHLDCIESCTHSDGKKDCPATGAHQLDCIEACSHAETLKVCKAEKHHYPDCIECCTLTESCIATRHKDTCFFAGMTYKATAALVNAVGSSELVVFHDASGTVYDVARAPGGWAIVGMDLNLDLLITRGTVAVDNPGSFAPGDVILMVTGYKGQTAAWHDTVVYLSGVNIKLTDEMVNAINGLGNMGGFGSYGSYGGYDSMGDLSSMIGGFSGFGSYGSAAQAETESLFDLEGDTLLTVTPRYQRSLIIAVDEHDIARVQVGQKTTVTLEALKGMTFDGEITDISLTGTNNGGSSKFAVEVTLEVPREAAESMYPGMSATAEIPMEVTENVLLLPLDALTQDSARTIVYTSLDENGDPASPVEVTTGASDGINVEIVSGLEKGQKVYYSYYDTLELDTSAEADRYTLN